MKFSCLRFYVLAVGIVVLLIVPKLIAQSVVVGFDMLPEPLQGIVLFPDGETPVAKLPIRLWSLKEKKFIYRADTDNDGTFRIPSLLTGDSLLFVGRLMVNLSVVEKSKLIGQQHDMILVVPRHMLVTGGRMFDVLISPILANVAVMGADKGVDGRMKGRERVVIPDDESIPSFPSEPPIVSP